MLKLIVTLSIIILLLAGHRLHLSPTCYEDEPCWNCHTMGNHICGK